MNRLPLVVPDKTELRDVLARALFQDTYRLRRWESANVYLERTFYRRADEAIRRAGVENFKIVAKKEKAHA